MNRQELFDKCIEEAMKLGRKYMIEYLDNKTPTQQEWDLALLLFNKEYAISKF